MQTSNHSGWSALVAVLLTALLAACQATPVPTPPATRTLPAATITPTPLPRAAASGLANEQIYSLAIDPLTPTNLYAATNDGVFKSTDGGANWAAANTGLPDIGIFGGACCLAIEPLTPATLYAVTEDGVFKSTDGATSWKPIELIPYDMNFLVIDPLTPATLYAGTRAGGVYKTTNGGRNWIAANTGITNTELSTVAIEPGTPTSLYAVSPDGLFKSVDGAKTWRLAGPGPGGGWPWRSTHGRRPRYTKGIKLVCSKAPTAA